MVYSYNLQLFAKDGEGGEKTEPATPKKLDKAREEGQAPKSQDLNTAVLLLVLFGCLKVFGSFMMKRLYDMFQFYYGNINDYATDVFTVKRADGLLQFGLKEITITLLPMLALAMIGAFVVNVVQVKWKVTLKPLQPKPNKINPISGFKRMFSKDKIFELIKAVVKVGILFYVVYQALKDEWGMIVNIYQLDIWSAVSLIVSTVLNIAFQIKDRQGELFVIYDMELLQAVALIAGLIVDVGLKTSLVYLIVGIADLIYQKHKFKEEMKMTKQEVKDEYKNTEGDPQIKGRQRQRMREASQRRMMQDVPKADVVITNPTHYAVAIRYDAEVSKAPVVVAKGEDFLAAKIKEVARENQVEIVENKPLARMLYANVNVGAEIPPELYQAVAEVLAMVYNLKGRN